VEVILCVTFAENLLNCSKAISVLFQAKQRKSFSLCTTPFLHYYHSLSVFISPSLSFCEIITKLKLLLIQKLFRSYTFQSFFFEGFSVFFQFHFIFHFAAHIFRSKNAKIMIKMASLLVVSHFLFAIFCGFLWIFVLPIGRKVNRLCLLNTFQMQT